MRIVITFALLSALMCGICMGTEIVVADVTGTSLATLDDATEVDYNIVEFEMPELAEGRVLTAAFVELYMDVSSTLPDSLTQGLATIEVAIMPALVGGKLDVSSDAIIAKRTVRVGDDRLIRVYITDLLLDAGGQLESPVVLLVGAVTGGRYARFEANAVPGAPGGAQAMVTIHSQAPPAQATALE
jgi:hypothetical protein